MKKYGKLLLLMALICACLMMCACESCKVTGDFSLNSAAVNITAKVAK